MLIVCCEDFIYQLQYISISVSLVSVIMHTEVIKTDLGLQSVLAAAHPDDSLVVHKICYT